MGQNHVHMSTPWQDAASHRTVSVFHALWCGPDPDRSLHFSPAHFSANATALLKVRAEDRTGSSRDLTSAAGTPSGGRQCRTIIPLIGTSLPWGSCSKFFLRSAGGDKQQLCYAQFTYRRVVAPARATAGGASSVTRRQGGLKENRDWFNIKANTNVLIIFKSAVDRFRNHRKLFLKYNSPLKCRPPLQRQEAKLAAVFSSGSNRRP